MTLWILAGAFFGILMTLAVAILWVRQMRPPKEDPRLSRGLQLLQSKISVLEDLSERTDVQVKQLVQILEDRARNLQSKILNAEEMVSKVERSMRKSLDVAEIFQDKIPHKEIIERNQTQKYVMAAKLANEGLAIEEIMKQVDIPRSELEFIVKVNRDELTFNPELLPEWAKPQPQEEVLTLGENQPMDRGFWAQTPDLSGLNRIDAEFKQTVREVREEEQRASDRQRHLEEKAQALKQAVTQTVSKIAEPVIKKVQFPRIFVE